jgi:hypothetical protein
MTEVHWLFKPMPDGVACLGIEIFPDGDYWVYDSPTLLVAPAAASAGASRCGFRSSWCCLVCCFSRSSVNSSAPIAAA